MPVARSLRLCFYSNSSCQGNWEKISTVSPIEQTQDQVIHKLSVTTKLIGFHETNQRTPSVNVLPSHPQWYLSKGRGRGAGMSPGTLKMPDDLLGGITGCWYCREQGHRRSEFRPYKEEQERWENDESSPASPPPTMVGYFRAHGANQESESGILSSTWVVDTVATSHTSNDIRLIFIVH